MNKLITAQELAALFDVSPSMIHDRVWDETFPMPAFQKGRMYLWERDAIFKWVIDRARAHDVPVDPKWQALEDLPEMLDYLGALKLVRPYLPKMHAARQASWVSKAPPWSGLHISFKLFPKRNDTEAKLLRGGSRRWFRTDVEAAIETLKARTEAPLPAPKAVQVKGIKRSEERQALARIEKLLALQAGEVKCKDLVLHVPPNGSPK